MAVSAPGDRAPVGPGEAALVLSTGPGEYTIGLLRGWFAAGPGRPARIDPRGGMEVPEAFRRAPDGPFPEGGWPARCAPGWGGVRATTPGRYAASNLVFSRSRELRAAFPYRDAPWDSAEVGRVQQGVADALLDGRISPEDAAWVVDRMQWLGYAPASFMAASMTIDTLRMPPAAAALKAAVMSGPRGDAFRSGDTREVESVAGELLAASRAGSRADPGMEIYDSGSRGSFGNNYKNTAVLRGAMRRSDDPSVIRVSAASLTEGIPAAEMPQYADLLVQASYGRSMTTRVGGYIQKQLNAAFQGLRLDPDPASDCGARLLLEAEVDDPSEYAYRWAEDRESPGGLREIAPSEFGWARGRRLRLRSPLFCGLPGRICSRCAGGLYYRMGITAVGLLCGRIGTTLMNGALKSFHDTTLKMTKIDLNQWSRETAPPRGQRPDDEDEGAGGENYQADEGQPPTNDAFQ